MWTASALRVSCSGGSGTPPSGGSDTGRCVSCAGRVEVYGTAPALDDGGLYRGIW